MTSSHRNLAYNAVAFFGAVALLSSLALAQSMAPGTGRPQHKTEETETVKNATAARWSAATPADKKKAEVDLKAAQFTAAVDANQKCADGKFTNVRWWLPVNYPGAGESATGSNMNGVICFFGNNGPAAFINQVQFLYGFGSSASSISVDITALQFGAGFQVSLGSTITGSSPNKSGSQTTQTGAASTDQAIQQLENGGDFYLKTIYPLIYLDHAKQGSSSDLSLLVAAVPRLGFTVPGMSSQTLLTESTEYNWNVPVEIYGQYTALGSGGLLYADIRSGYQYVKPDFASAAGLGSKNNFLLTQVAAGIQFNGLIRLGFQKFYGPAQLFNVNQSEFKKWHLVIQFAPNQMNTSKKTGGQT